VAVVLIALLAASGVRARLPLRAATAPDAGRTERRTIDVAGRTRHYLLHRPGSPGDHLPLVLALHGAGGTGASMEADTGLSEVADRRGFAVAYPDGLHGTWNAGGCCLESVAEDVPDLALLSRLIDELAAEGAIDRSRVFVTGFSNGAMMAGRVACELPGILGLAMVAGAQVSPCATTSASTVLLVHGMVDQMVPPAGYTGDIGQGKPLVYPPLRETADRWRALLACAVDPDESTTGGIRVLSWAHCARGRHVELVELDGMGHGWPGNRDLATPDDQGFDATAAIVRSFELDR
jgi:polyhydroxybutyrate depolymerase